MPRSFKEEIESKVLELLAEKPHTLPELEKKTAYNYYTLRKYMVEMQKRGEIRQLFNGNARNIRWTIGEDTNVNNSIPTLIAMNKRAKLNLFMNVTTTQTEQAAANLPMHITALFDLAIKARDGEDISKRLQALRVRIEKDHEIATRSVDLYQQILSDPRAWNTTYLSRFPADTQFDLDKFTEAKSKFFGEDD